MDLINDVLKRGSDPGKFLAQELREAISPITEKVSDVESRLERVEKSLETLAKLAESVQPIINAISKFSFLKPKR